MRPWDPFHACHQDYPITEYQPIYYAATSFEDAKRQLIKFAESFSRPFGVRYNPYTQGLEVDGNIKMSDLAEELAQEKEQYAQQLEKEKQTA